MRRAVLALLALAACAAPAAERRLDEPAPAIAPQPGAGRWQLTWRGAPIGVAWQTDDGVVLSRRERVIVRRGDAVVLSELAIRITRDAADAAQAVTVRRWGDGPALAGRATRTARGWAVEVDGEAAISLPPAVPFEQALATAARAGGFHGKVLLAGWGFAVADLALAPGPGGIWEARLTIDGRATVARIRYDATGAVREIGGGDGVVARATREDLPWPPPTVVEVVDGSALYLSGATAAAPAGVRFPDAVTAPAALPGQRISADGGGWLVRFATDDAPAADLAPLAALVRRVAGEVDDDLGASATTTGAALAATRGDCTTHALRFAALAAQAGIRTRVVTGLRLDGAELVRHRFDLAWTDGRWIAVDPTWGETPARLVIALAVHGARAADLAAADATVFDGLGARAIAVR